MRACWLKWVGRDWSISADYIWLNYSDANTVECRLLPDENHPGCKIEKYDHAELDLGCSLADFSWKVSVPSLEEAEDGLMLKLPHRV